MGGGAVAEGAAGLGDAVKTGRAGGLGEEERPQSPSEDSSRFSCWSGETLSSSCPVELHMCNRHWERGTGPAQGERGGGAWTPEDLRVVDGEVRAALPQEDPEILRMELGPESREILLIARVGLRRTGWRVKMTLKPAPDGSDEPDCTLEGEGPLMGAATLTIFQALEMAKEQESGPLILSRICRAFFEEVRTRRLLPVIAALSSSDHMLGGGDCIKQIFSPIDLPIQACRTTHLPPSEQETADRLPLKLLGMDQANATVDLRIDAGVCAGSLLDLGVDIRITVPEQFPHAVAQLELIEAWGNGGASVRRMSEAFVAQCQVRLEEGFARRPEGHNELPEALAELHNKLRDVGGMPPK